ncbi:MAG TPA: response regulator [Kofleriaceae bacterium]|nr:response regulator [Kofleriaceae bacterium]
MLARGTRDDLVRIPRVLVADDDALLRGLMVEALRDQCEVIEAVDGADALEKTAEIWQTTKRLPDAYVIEVRMPHLSGIHVMCAIRGFDRHVPIVLTTAHDDLATRSIALRWGAVLIEKPFDIAALCGAVLEVSRNTPPDVTPSRAYTPRPVRIARRVTS